MVKDSYPTAKLKAPLRQQGAEHTGHRRNRQETWRSTEYRPIIRALLMLAMAEGVGNNELSRQRRMIRALARQVEYRLNAPDGTREGFGNKSKQSATCTSELRR
jgi:hypothetical protein